MSTSEHRKHALSRLNIGLITVSTSRTIKTDQSGDWMGKLIKNEGHYLQFHLVIPDDQEMIAETVTKKTQEQQTNVIILSGGTGISRRDVTIEAVRPLFDKELTAFGSIFAQLSFDVVDTAAIISRATAGTIGQCLIFCIPGSFKACKLACKELIFPELGHLVKHMQE